MTVRDIRTGQVLAKITSGLFIDIAAFAGNYLFFSGTDVNQAAPGDPDIYPGGGILAIDLSGDGAVLQVVPPEPTLRMSVEPFGDGIRAPFVVSATGQTLASAVYLEEGATGRVDVVDTTTLTTRTTLPRYAYAITDTYALTQAAPGSKNDVELIDIGSGETAWASRLSDGATAPVMIFSSVADELGIVIQFERSPNLIVAVIDVVSGSMRELLVQDGSDRATLPLYMEANLSSTSTIILLESPGVASALADADGHAYATVLDAATGKLQSRAFQVGHQ